MNADVEEVAETLLGRCARPRPRLVCVGGEVVAVEVENEDRSTTNGRQDLGQA
jgi:hypothetical protein